VTFEDVASIGCTLEDVERTTAWGQPALKVRGRMFVCMAAHRSAEPNSLVVMMDRSDRDALITDAPDTSYLKDHYLNHPCVLVRLSHVRQDALRDVVVGAYRFVQNRITRKVLAAQQVTPLASTPLNLAPTGVGMYRINQALGPPRMLPVIARITVTEMSTICQRHCAADFVSLFERKKDHDTHSESHHGNTDRRRHRGWRLRRAAGAWQWESLGNRIWSAGRAWVHSGARAGPQQPVTRAPRGARCRMRIGRRADRAKIWDCDGIL